MTQVAPPATRAPGAALVSASRARFRPGTAESSGKVAGRKSAMRSVLSPPTKGAFTQSKRQL